MQIWAKHGPKQILRLTLSPNPVIRRGQKSDVCVANLRSGKGQDIETKFKHLCLQESLSKLGRVEFGKEACENQALP